VKEGARKLLHRFLPEGGISRQSGLTMLFSFLLASALWFLVIINQEDHKSSFILPIHINNLPKNVDYLKPIPKEVEVSVEGFGVDLLVQHFQYQPDTVQLYYTPERDFLLTRDYFSQIIQKTPKSTDIKVLRVSPDTLPIQYEFRTQKKVRLFSRAILNLAPNVQLESAYQIRPDSINISGPQSMLDTIEAWYTRQQEVFVDEKSKNVIIPVDTMEGIRVSPSSATLNMRTSLFTQKKVLISITISDLPEDTEVSLNPPTVNLNCLVPMKEYDRFKDKYNFTIPFSDLDETIPYFIPPVEKVLPGFAKIVTRAPFQVDFIVIEKLDLQ
jgi:hypothetical protein